MLRSYGFSPHRHRCTCWGLLSLLLLVLIPLAQPSRVLKQAGVPGGPDSRENGPQSWVQTFRGKPPHSSEEEASLPPQKTTLTSAGESPPAMKDSEEDPPGPDTKSQKPVKTKNALVSGRRKKTEGTEFEPETETETAVLPGEDGPTTPVASNLPGSPKGDAATTANMCDGDRDVDPPDSETRTVSADSTPSSTGSPLIPALILPDADATGHPAEPPPGPSEVSPAKRRHKPGAPRRHRHGKDLRKWGAVPDPGGGGDPTGLKQYERENMRKALLHNALNKDCSAPVTDMLKKKDPIPLSLRGDICACFKPLRHLGSGGFADVFESSFLHDPYGVMHPLVEENGRGFTKFAMKVSRAPTKNYVHFSREAQVFTGPEQLMNFNLKMQDKIGASVEIDSVAIVMQKGEGSDLFDFVKNHFDHKPVLQDHVFRFLAKAIADLAGALSVMAQRDLFLRDIKAENVIVDDSWPLDPKKTSVMIVDVDPESFTPALTFPYEMLVEEGPGMISATPVDTRPEQGMWAVWHLGVIAFFVLTGRLPYVSIWTHDERERMCVPDQPNMNHAEMWDISRFLDRWPADSDLDVSLSTCALE
uniref:Protein kinase domain-containing protein n=1 Tax=Chromera velia CCMP2878 TaxID=1169474 RepID=A0A0G4IDA5_9ALVE|eukprot:Cvel_13348.t1-p1 / transcript=Cvel_13348.t1 / gene=Cvel_13348 / organism=Chromera_velia_CCMP2878 / gene_product=Serine/threonine-protein kinase CLA4, putative / transcript_product=Serine/threonine-protein kinase CLA4, putative / location=Cvel_scaffold907:1799-7329(+) / protein_length=588 / sequence_SO=supercontig / SO=protein_coding / is_pseudo=false